MCVLRLQLCENALPQPGCVHAYGFSPVWERMCLVRFPFCVNALPQREHTYGFSPVWVRMCTVRLPTSVNALPQREHVGIFWTIGVFAWPLLALVTPLPFAHFAPSHISTAHKITQFRK